MGLNSIKPMLLIWDVANLRDHIITMLYEFPSALLLGASHKR